METRTQVRPAAVRRRGAPRARVEGPDSPRPSVLSRLAAGLGTADFWWWWLAKLAGLAVLLATVGLLYHVLTSGSYYASEITVEGNRLLGTQEVVDAAAVSGVHILWVNRRQAAQRLRALPAVEQADIRVLFPRRVTIRIAERTPYAQWQTAGGAFLVDAEGLVIGPAGRDASLVAVREVGGSTVQLGGRVPAEAIRAAVELSELLPPAWQPSSGTFDYAPDTGIRLLMRNGWQVRFGDNESLAWKVATFQALAAEIERSGARVQLVDVRFPGRPYYR